MPISGTNEFFQQVNRQHAETLRALNALDAGSISAREHLANQVSRLQEVDVRAAQAARLTGSSSWASANIRVYANSFAPRTSMDVSETQDQPAMPEPFISQRSGFDRDYARAITRQEFKYIQQVFTTGIRDWEVRIHIDGDHTYITSPDYGEGWVVAHIADGKLEYRDRRVRHLMPILTEYAERKGLELVDVGNDARLQTPPDNAVLLRFWGDGVSDMVDDSELVGRTTISVRSFDYSEPDMDEQFVSARSGLGSWLPF